MDQERRDHPEQREPKPFEGASGCDHGDDEALFVHAFSTYSTLG